MEPKLFITVDFIFWLIITATPLTLIGSEPLGLQISEKKMTEFSLQNGLNPDNKPYKLNL